MRQKKVKPCGGGKNFIGAKSPLTKCKIYYIYWLEGAK